MPYWTEQNERQHRWMQVHPNGPGRDYPQFKDQSVLGLNLGGFIITDDPSNLAKENISYAYVHAVSAAAGFSCSPFGGNDVISLDIKISPLRSMVGDGERINPILFAQLKCTATHDFDGDGRLAFPLPVNNYNDLRQDDGSNKILILFLVPAELGSWIHQDHERMLTRKCAYAISLRGSEATENTDTVTVYFSKEDILSVERLASMMDRISRRHQI